MPRETRVDIIIKRVKNHKVFSVFIITGIFLIALSQLTSAVSTIIEIFKPNDTSSIERIKHINDLLGPVYFDLDLSKLHRSPDYKDIGSLNPNKDHADPFGRRSELDPQSSATLKGYAEHLRNLPDNYILLITGYTSRERPAANIILAKTRVKNVFEYLQDLGIPPERMQCSAPGGAGTESRNKNDPYTERVEFRVYLDKQVGVDCRTIQQLWR